MTGEVRVGISMTTRDPHIVTRVSEQLGRIAAGYAMEGIECMLTIGPEFSFEEQEEDAA